MVYVDNFIDPAVFSKWIIKQFISVRIKIKLETVKEILDYSRSHPYYTQKLCYTLWWLNADKKNSKELNNNDLRETLIKILKMETNVYQERVDKLSKNQKRVLNALAKIEKGEGLFSKEIIKQYSLPALGSIRDALKQLEQEINPLIIKLEDGSYEIEDPFFELWLKGN